MSFSAEHYFWQQRVDREIGARNRFIENNFIRNKSDFGLSFGPDNKISANGSFNLYEVGQSDPNNIKPREFKYHYSNVPLEFSQTTYDKLAQLTSQNSNLDTIVKKKKGPINEYTGYQQKSRADTLSTGGRALSQLSQKRKSFAMIAATNLQPQQVAANETTYDGKKRRQRFNEDVDETLSRNAAAFQNSVHARKSYSLSKNSLKNFNQASKTIGDGNSETQSQMSKVSKLKSIVPSIKSQYLRKTVNAKNNNNDNNSETSQKYREKIQGIVNQLDDNQLERLGQELGSKIDEENEDYEDENNDYEQMDIVNDLDNNVQKSQLNPEETRSQQLFLSSHLGFHRGKDDLSMSDVRSVTSEIRSAYGGSKSLKSNYSAINKLASQLEEERKERERLRKEIEDLKKMNSDLCNAIFQPGSPLKKQ